MPADVRVRTETPMLGLAWGEEVTLTRSPLVEAAIAEGRLTVLDSDGDPAPLKGAALDAALEAAGLPTAGTADAKRARLEEHRDAQAEAAASPGDDETTPPASAARQGR
jgi:hypothetical protein